MLIELRKLCHYPRMSEETNAFNANLYINGKFVGYAKNDGKGGMTDYRPAHTITGAKEAIAEAEAFCKTLPPATEHNIPMDLEFYIDQLVYTTIKKKEEEKAFKKIMKSMVNNIVVGKREDIYSYGTYKFNRPLSELMNPRTLPWFLTELKKIKSQLKEGESILNDNIPKEVMAQVN